MKHSKPVSFWPAWYEIDETSNAALFTSLGAPQVKLTSSSASSSSSSKPASVKTGLDSSSSYAAAGFIRTPVRSFLFESSLLSSPVLHPLHHDIRSPSPMFFLDDEEDFFNEEFRRRGYRGDSASLSGEEGIIPYSELGIRSFLPMPSSALTTDSNNNIKPLTVSTSTTGSPLLFTKTAWTTQQENSATSSRGSPLSSSTNRDVYDSEIKRPLTPTNAAGGGTGGSMSRSLSDGDLSDYLKGFSELRDSIRLAKTVCDDEIQRMIVELNEIAESSIKSVSGKSSSNTSPPRRLSLDKTLSPNLGTIVAGIDEDAEISPLTLAISELISLAQTVIESDMTQLMSQGTTRTLMSKMMHLHELWLKNPTWDCRQYIVRLLLVFASVARLVEHMEEDSRMWLYITSGSGSAPRPSTFQSFKRYSVSGGVKSLGATATDQMYTAEGFVETMSDRGGGSNSGHGINNPETSSLYDSVADSASEDVQSDNSSVFSTGRNASGRKYKKRRGNLLKKMHSGSGKDSLQEMAVEHSESEQSYLDYHPFSSANDLKEAAVEVQSVNVVVEMSLDGTIVHISPACRTLFGLEPFQLLGTKGVSFFAQRGDFKSSSSDDSKIFSEGLTMLMNDDNITVELSFTGCRADGRLLQIESKGMMMYDQLGRQRSVIWILRPIGLVGEGWGDAVVYDEEEEEEEEEDDDELVQGDFDEISGVEQEEEAEEEESAETSERQFLLASEKQIATEAVVATTSSTTPLTTKQQQLAPSPTSLAKTGTSSGSGEEDDAQVSSSSDSGGDSLEQVSIDLILCHICERSIPALLFERHSELCVEVHRAEMEISLTNDEIKKTQKKCSDKLTLLEEMNAFNAGQGGGLGDEGGKGEDDEIDPFEAEYGSGKAVEVEDVDQSNKISQHLSTLIDIVRSTIEMADSVLGLSLDVVKLISQLCVASTDVSVQQVLLLHTDSDSMAVLSSMPASSKLINLLDWKCPLEKEFYPNDGPVDEEDERSVSNMVDVALRGIGKGIHQLSQNLELLIRKKMRTLIKLYESSLLYDRLAIEEETKKMEIGMETGALVDDNAPPSTSEDAEAGEEEEDEEDENIIHGDASLSPKSPLSEEKGVDETITTLPCKSHSSNSELLVQNPAIRRLSDAGSYRSNRNSLLIDNVEIVFNEGSQEISSTKNSKSGTPARKLSYSLGGVNSGGSQPDGSRGTSLADRINFQNIIRSSSDNIGVDALAIESVHMSVDSVQSENQSSLGSSSSMVNRMENDEVNQGSIADNEQDPSETGFVKLPRKKRRSFVSVCLLERKR